MAPLFVHMAIGTSDPSQEYLLYVSGRHDARGRNGVFKGQSLPFLDHVSNFRFKISSTCT